MAASPNPEAQLPLSPTVFAILLALSTGEKHGYAIMKEAVEPDGGGIRLGPGTLYGSLDRMVRDGLVEETGFTDDARRRYYRISSLGLRVFAQEFARINSIVAAVNGRALPKGARA